MPKYFCDYCDTYLTHDSPSVRKTHCAGRKHKENVKAYYQNWLEQEAKNLIDITTAAFKNGTLVSQPPLMAQPQLQLMPQSPTPLLSTTPQPMLHPLQTNLQQLQLSPQQFQLQPQPSPHLQTHLGLNHHHQLLPGQHHQLQVHTSLAAPPSIQQTLQQSTSLPSLQLAAAGTVGGQLVVQQQRPPPATTPQHLAAAQSAFLQHHHHQQQQHQHNHHQQQPHDISINVPSAVVTAAAMHLPNGSVAMAGPHHPHHPQHHPQLHPHPHHPQHHQQLPLPPPHGFTSQPLLNPFLHSQFRPPMGLLIFRPQM